MENMEIEREKYSNLIIQSPEKSKLIVAGPGTGKSFTFRQLLKQKKGNCLVLTFINSLVNEFKSDLKGIAEAYTFHGYCKKILHGVSVPGIDVNFEYFPYLPQIIESDAKILKKDFGEFNKAFQILEENERDKFYLERADYYNSVGHNDSVYRVLKYFQSNEKALPKFNQIIVDEYQDFNLLEVAFIDELLKVSPILIAGDDDQAIYDFKNASASHIQKKAQDESFCQFKLPYCSRCTQVIVNATTDIINEANKINKLRNRIVKEFLCYLPDKKQDSENHPKIIHARCSIHGKDWRNYTGRFIEMEITKIPKGEIELAKKDKHPCILIAGPKHYLDQIYPSLKQKFSDIDYLAKKENWETYLLKGYQMLLRNIHSNLGWRILLSINNDMEKRVISLTNRNYSNLWDLLDKRFIKEHTTIIELLRKAKTGNVNEGEKKFLTEKILLPFEDIVSELNKTTTEEENEVPFIKMTTINGCKGLSANYVFMVGMDNYVFPKNPLNITDNEISQFIVGLTRTRKKCYLTSIKMFGGKWFNPSAFINWIDSSRIEQINVDKNYFNK